MAKNLAKATGACNAKDISNGSDFRSPWVIYNPDSSRFKVLYSTNGILDESNSYYDSSNNNEFHGCNS
jgi:hypothetical protein